MHRMCGWLVVLVYGADAVHIGHIFLGRRVAMHCMRGRLVVLVYGADAVHIGHIFLGRRVAMHRV